MRIRRGQLLEAAVAAASAPAQCERAETTSPSLYRVGVKRRRTSTSATTAVRGMPTAADECQMAATMERVPTAQCAPRQRLCNCKRDKDFSDNNGPSAKRGSRLDLRPLQNGCEDVWTWSTRHRSHETKLYDSDNRTVMFHPNFSNGTAAIRGDRVLNGQQLYWEIEVSHRLFGTSLMFGIGTEKASLHKDYFTNLLGENEHSWGLSHKGYIWHDGGGRPFADPFEENRPTTVGLHFDGKRGTLSYYKNGQPLGIAFTGLDAIIEPLYPMLASTAARTEMTLGIRRRAPETLEDVCISQVAHLIANQDRKADSIKLPLPARVRERIDERLRALRGLYY